MTFFYDKHTTNLDIEDISNLSLSVLVRYKALFNLSQEPNKLKDKEDLTNLVFNHLNTFEIDEEEVIQQFLQVEKDSSILNNSNMRKSTRHQDKLDKLSFVKGKQKNNINQ